MFRVGLGQDTHAFSSDENRKLVLGGVTIEGAVGLAASSDGDVVLHSLCNALSSAVGGDSLGTWADELCLEQGVKDSRVYVEKIVAKIARMGLVVGNVSISVEAKHPRISPRTIQAVKNGIAKLLDVQPQRVGVTFTSGDGLTSFGRGEGIQVFSMVLLCKHD